MTQNLIRLHSVAKAFGGKDVLLDVSFQVQIGDRVGVIGENGAGKSTLLGVIIGEISPDAGSVLWFDKSCSYHYVSQSREEVVTKDNATLSGGELTRLALQRAFASRADLLILDEPTNHLDADGIRWLIDEVKGYPGTVVAVSHDRYYLDQTVFKIVAIQDARARVYGGNYSFYAAERDREHASLLHQYETQKKEQERIANQIAEVKQWAQRGHKLAGKQGTLSERKQLGYKQHHRAKVKKLDKRVKSQLKRLEKLQSESTSRPSEATTVKFEVSQAMRHGRSMIEARALTKRFGDNVLWRDSQFFVRRGEKVGLLGPNGCGKTTLLKTIVGEEPVTEGELWVSPTAKIAYLSQYEDFLSVADSIRDMTLSLPAPQRKSFQSMLAGMQFDEYKLTTPIANLSLGEQMRLKLAWVNANEFTMLILDEPTNHLDIVSREELERALQSYQGTLLVVSHDRALMESLCNTMLVFESRRIQKVDGPLNCSKHDKQAELMVIENKISRLLGDLSGCKPSDAQYQIWDAELNGLMRRRQQIRENH